MPGENERPRFPTSLGPSPAPSRGERVRIYPHQQGTEEQVDKPWPRNQQPLFVKLKVSLCSTGTQFPVPRREV